MKENAKTAWLAVGVAAVLALAVLVYVIFPNAVKASGLDGGDLGEGALVAVILYLALRGRTPLPARLRVILAVAVGAGLLLGMAVFFIS
jgi:hypothetical protein